jgi:alpha-beta hydrolase superfamily lysophospholipase
MSHGARTTRVVVLFHGLTNCPEQFRLLGERFYARGANVLIPRLPRHGLADRMTTELARLDARELCDATDEVLDVADGLGDTVVVLGLSAGGVMAAWAAQERSDVACAVPIAPLLATGLVHGLLTPAATRLGLLLPNAFVWWDPHAREELGGPRHVYPRFSTRATAQSMLLGAAIEARALRERPQARAIVMITVGGDAGVDNRASERLVAAWRAHGASVVAYQFPARLHLNHDIIDPEQVGANPALVYPVIEGLVAP